MVKARGDGPQATDVSRFRDPWSWIRIAAVVAVLCVGIVLLIAVLFHLETSARQWDALVQAAGAGRLEAIDGNL